MNDDFLKGYEQAAKNASNIIGASEADDYIQEVNLAVDQVVFVMKDLEGSKLPVDSLKGFIAEKWHAGTFNINSVVNDSGEWASVPSSNTFASPDIRTSWGEYYGSKYYQSAEATAKAQSISLEEYYKKAIAGNPSKLSFQEFCSQRGIDDIGSRQYKSIYENQTRLVPSDQLNDIGDELKQKAIKAAYNRPELTDKFEETGRRIADRINSPNGNSSIPLSEEEAKKIARNVKEGEFNRSEFGLETKEFVKFENIINEAIKAGLTAAVITVVLKNIPNIIVMFEKTLKDEEISLEDFSEMGFCSLSVASQSFLRGTTAATLTASFKSGLAGEVAKTINPTVIGAITAITFNIIESSIKLGTGKISETEYANSCLRDVLIGTLPGIGSITGQALLPIPVLGLLIGSLIGSMVGAFVYTASNKVLLKVSITSGLTYLKLVEQDYSMPVEILEFMGLKVIEGKTNLPNINRPIIIKPICNIPLINKPKTNLPFIVNRGIIGINKIGYLIVR